MYWVSIVVIGLLAIAMSWAIALMIIDINKERNKT